MFCLYSKSCEYALRALVEIVKLPAGGCLRAEELCQRASIPLSYARKSVQSLVRSGILNAAPGPRGGYSIAVNPKKTSVLDVVRKIEGENFLTHCVMGFPTCGNERPCSLHKSWLDVKETILSNLAAQNLHDLAQSGAKPVRGKKR